MSDKITVHIKSGQNNWSVEVEQSATIRGFKEKISEVSDVPADNQRLIYSGKILKDGETVESYKIQDGHSVHMVKSGGARAASGTSGASTAAEPALGASGAANSNGGAAVPSNISAGQTGGFNPLADLTGARYAGLTNLPSADMFGPDGGLNSGEGANAESMLHMLENPIFQSQMNEMLSNPQMVDFLIQQNPQLQALGPRAREVLQSPFFRQMMTDPQMIRQSMQMASSMGLSPDGGAASSFPAPGSAGTQSTTATRDDASGTSGNTGNTGASSGNTGGAAANPFASLFGNAGGAGGAAAANPFAGLFPQGQQPQFNPELFASMFGGAAQPPTQPADNRPPEERYESQLRQLNDMGFFDFDRNVAALRRSGGSVQGALDALLNGDV